ncbi:phenylacetaldoxime dehydratase family protein [Nocardia nova]|uniref:phenylacetaldoxime dehydratase family protein n=1 Tax=Nocardia nova TaxID=37330 RepID=UPI0018947F48|nr:phenylacetaldoxime dehydratase family protein [Nocardia nova]MBF6148272.1 phenylacetaldoxime dehydratase family protein [Nocardia nova]
MRVNRLTADLSGYPDLVVIYLGMRVRTPRGVLRLLGLGPKLYRSHRDRPDGLLRHEDIIWSLFPPHWGARQYWRDLDSLERWTRSQPHRDWWQRFLRDSGGTGFWHEAYFLRGGIDTMYDDMTTPTGLGAFAPTRAMRGPLFSARGRAQDNATRAGTDNAHLGTEPTVAPVVEEASYYRNAYGTEGSDTDRQP